MTKLSDTSRANKSGIELEAELKNFLIQNSFVFRHQIPGQNEIDFIIGNEDNKLYADCTNQNSSGSVDEKIPHKIWKYYKKYNYSSVYIIRGSHKPRDLILEHCEEIAQRNNFKFNIVTLDVFRDIISNNIHDNGIEKFLEDSLPEILNESLDTKQKTEYNDASAA